MKLPVKDCRVCIGKTVYPKIPSENGISKEKYLNSIRRVLKMLCQAWRLIDRGAWKFDLIRATFSQNEFENLSKWSSTCNWNDQAHQRIKGLFHINVSYKFLSSILVPNDFGNDRTFHAHQLLHCCLCNGRIPEDERNKGTAFVKFVFYEAYNLW